MSDFDLHECRNNLEKQILELEKRTLVSMTTIQGDVKSIDKALQELVTRTEFHPVQLITYGLAGGVLIAALGAVLAKVLGW